MTNIPNRSKSDPAIAARLTELAAHAKTDRYADDLADECRLLLGDNRALGNCNRLLRETNEHLARELDRLRALLGLPV